MQVYAASIDQVNTGSSNNTDSLTGMLTSGAVVAVAGYLVSSQKKPSPQWLAVYESTMQSMLTSRSDLSALTLTGEQLAQGLAAMQAWGCKPSSGFRAAALDRSRFLLAGSSLQGLGPMLLGLCSIGAKPPRAWVLDWCAIVQQQLQQQQQQQDAAAVADGSDAVGSSSSSSSSSDPSSSSSSSCSMGCLSTLAAALAASGQKPISSSSSASWWDCYCQAVRPVLPTASLVDLSTMLQALQQLTGGSDGFRPDGVQGWMEAVAKRVEEVTRRERGGSSSGSTSATASPREVQLLELYWEALKTKLGYARR
jgi:hypothetical protein